MKQQRLLKILFGASLMFSSLSSVGQYQVDLVSMYDPRADGGVLEFGDIANIKVHLTIDSSSTLDKGLAYLSNYYLIVDGIPMPDKKIETMSRVLTQLIADNSRNKTFAIVYQTRLPNAMEDNKGKQAFTKLWEDHYLPWHHQQTLQVALLSTRPEDGSTKETQMKLKFYSICRLIAFVLIFVALLAVTIYWAAKDKFVIFRDEKATCSNPASYPYSLSRLQVFLWTFVIFGLFALIWSITGFLPELTASHLVLLGIAAGQRIIAKMIDSQYAPAKYAKATRLNANGCSVGFLRDLISDDSGLSITRLQYLIATVIFLVVFVTNAIEHLHFVNFSVEQLGLMGTSAGLYLWNKKLDQTP